MNAIPFNKANAIRAAAFIAPVLIVQSTHRMLAAPAPLAAFQDPMPTAALVYTPPKATPDQLAAIDYINILSTTDLENSPFYYAPDTPPAVAFEPDIDHPTTFDVSDVRVSSISGNGDNTFAIINGIVCQVGDLIEPGIAVQNIDPEARTVTLKPTEGKPIALSLIDPLAD